MLLGARPRRRSLTGLASRGHASLPRRASSFPQSHWRRTGPGPGLRTADCPHCGAQLLFAQPPPLTLSPCISVRQEAGLCELPLPGVFVPGPLARAKQRGAPAGRRKKAECTGPQQPLCQATGVSDHDLSPQAALPRAAPLPGPSGVRSPFPLTAAALGVPSFLIYTPWPYPHLSKLSLM